MNDSPRNLPALGRDPAFYGYLATQFFGAFNDNLFKQLMLLLAIPAAAVVVNDMIPEAAALPAADLAANAAAGTDVAPGVAAPAGKAMDLQGLATVLFGIPFVIFGGLAGWVADHFSKRNVMVIAKLAEIVIVSLGLCAFLAVPNYGMLGLWVVLFMLGTHSTFFGPGKYGILPEMLRKEDLSKANGLVGMTTFLSIIFGTALAGPLKDFFTTIDPVTGKEDATGLWRASFVCVVIAILGTLTSLLLRKPPPADRTTPLTMDALAVPQATRTLLVRDLPLTYALLASCAFWLIAGLALQSVNALGKTQLGLSDTKTSLMTSIISLGIAAGAVVAGYMSRRVGERRLVKIGNWGVIACCIVLSITVPGKGHLLGFGGSLVMLVILGAAAALFAIPVQVFIQSRPPEDMKGRTIAFMNQANFAAIVLAGIMYMLMDLILLTFSWPRSAAFAMMAIVYVPVALFYSLPSASAES